MRKERYVFLRKEQFSGLDFFKFMGYIERMKDEGLIERVFYIENKDSRDKMLVLFDKEYYAIKKFLKAEEKIFVGKIQVSRELKERDLKQLKRQFEGLEYRIYIK